MNDATALWTIGHSTRTIAEFTEILALAAIEVVVDVRTIPRSRTNPQYNQDQFPDALARIGVAYTHAPGLGGRRGKDRDVPPDVNAFWRHQAFHNYADYALGTAFGEALGELRELARTRRCVLMCSEAVWWRCHRRIVTDYVLAWGDDVYHLMSPTHAESASMTPGAVPRPDGTIVYP